MERARMIWQKGIAMLFCQLILLALASVFSTAAYAQEPSKADLLLTKISQSYEKNSGVWQVMELNACGLGATADSEALLKETVAAVKDKPADATQLQRNIIALTAAGYDCTALHDGLGKVDAVEKMASAVDKDAFISAKVSALLAYASGDYEVPKTAALNEEQLIKRICVAQLLDGGFAFFGNASDADMTALTINALLPYVERNAVAKDAVAKAREALLALQHSDGTWGSGAQKNGNANSTAFAVIALCALGVDPAKPLENSKVTPLNALLSFAAADNSGFLYAGNLNALATEQGFRALIACKGFEAEKGAYNIYTQASKANAVFKPATVVKSDPKPSKEATSADKPAKSDNRAKVEKPVSSKTSDTKCVTRERSASSQSLSVSDDDEDGSDTEDADDVDDAEDAKEELGVPEDDDDVFDEPDGEGSAAGADVLAVQDDAGVAGSSDDKTAWGLIAAGVLLLALACALYLCWGIGRRKGK